MYCNLRPNKNILHPWPAVYEYICIFPRIHEMSRIWTIDYHYLGHSSRSSIQNKHINASIVMGTKIVLHGSRQYDVSDINSVLNAIKKTPYTAMGRDPPALGTRLSWCQLRDRFCLNLFPLQVTQCRNSTHCSGDMELFMPLLATSRIDLMLWDKMASFLQTTFSNDFCKWNHFIWKLSFVQLWSSGFDL